MIDRRLPARQFVATRYRFAAVPKFWISMRNGPVHLGHVESRALGGQRDQGQPAQLLHAIARIVVDVAFPLDQHAAAGLREEAERQMVGECPAGQEDGGLFAEHRR